MNDTDKLEEYKQPSHNKYVIAAMAAKIGECTEHTK